MKVHPTSVEVTREDFAGLWSVAKEAWRRLRVPKNKTGRIGIVIALKTERVREKVLLESDLVRALNRHLEHSTLTGVCHVVQFGPRLSSSIESPRAAERYMWRSRSHLIIYGDFVERSIEGAPNYVLRLHGVVGHRPVPREVSQVLGKDFRAILPNQLIFPQSHEFLGLEATREWLGFVATYVIGVAMLISGDLALAEKFFTTLELELSQHAPKGDSNPILSSLKQRVQARMIDLRHDELTERYGKFVKSRQRDHILNGEPSLADLFARSPDDYRGKLQLAILHFFKGSVENAISVLEGVNNPDATWRFSLAFLYAYDSQIDKALDQYRRAFYGTTPLNVVLDTEMFISDVLEREPLKIQFYFFRGLLNYKAKPDYKLAKEDFEIFLESDASNEFPKLVELAKKFIAESKSHLGI